MVPRRGGRQGVRRGRKAPARAGVRGRKSVVRRRQSVRQQSKGLPKRQTLQSSLGGLTMSRFKAANRVKGIVSTIKKVGSPNFLNLTYPGVLQTLGGKQGNASWYLNCGNDLRRIWASIQSQFVYRNATNAEFAATTNTPGGSTNASFRYVLESSISCLYMANTCGTPVNVELYDIVATRDSPQIPTDFEGNVMPSLGKDSQGTLVMDPSAAWRVGMTNQSSAATGFEAASTVEKADPSNLGATPYQSKLFKDYFKVIRKTNVSLPIGGQHKHYVDLKPNRVIDNDFVQQNNVYKGLSFFTLVVVSGVPVISCPDTDPTHVLRNTLGDSTTSAVSLSLIQSIKYKWTWVEDTRENIYRANYINTETLNSAQSIQPAMTKVDGCEDVLEITKEGTFTYLPSECTR